MGNIPGGCNCGIGDVIFAYDNEEWRQFYKNELGLKCDTLYNTPTNIHKYELAVIRWQFYYDGRPNWMDYALSGEWEGRLYIEIPVGGSGQNASEFNKVPQLEIKTTVQLSFASMGGTVVGDFMQTPILTNPSAYISSGGVPEMEWTRDGVHKTTIATQQIGKTQVIVNTAIFGMYSGCDANLTECPLIYCQKPDGYNERFVRLLWEKPLPDDE